MAKQKARSLFEATGFGLQYLVVDKDTLNISATGVELPADNAAKIIGELQRKSDPASHVLVLRTIGPTANIPSLEAGFRAEVRTTNAALASTERVLLPVSVHPLRHAVKENGPGEHDPVPDPVLRDLASGDPWSVHLDLPFANDDEFSKLHTAIRMVLPIIPALCACSPIMNGEVTGLMDTRMHQYLTRQQRFPELMGPLIPEAVFNQEDYYRVIFEPIARALQPLDTDGVMDYQLLNGRGAIARFDRGDIRIRVMDVQECPSADLAIAEMIVAVLKAMVAGKWVSNYLQRAWHESDLLAIFRDVIVHAGDTVIANKDFLLMFGMRHESATANELWRHLYQQLRADLSEGARVRIAHILDQGCLAQRIIKRTGEKPSRERIIEVYREMAACLEDDKQLTSNR